MIRRVVPNRPRFRLRWLASTDGPEPDWLSDREWVPRGNRTLYRRVKDGFRALLVDIDRDGPVLLPAYVPGGLVAAVLASGFDVRYYPVRADLSLPVDAVERRIDSLSPSAVLFVHYLGFAAEAYSRLRETTEDRGALVVEDCARGLFSRGADGELLGSTGDVALYCVYKTLPATNGGLIVRRDAPLRPPEGTASEWGDLARIAAASVAGRVGVDGRGTPRPVSEGRRTPSVGEDPVLPPRAPGPLSRRALRRTRPEAVQSRRLDRYRSLYDRLAGAAVRVVTPPAPDGASPYGLGVLAPSEDDRNRLFEELRRRRLPGEVLAWPPVYRHRAVESMAGAMALRRRLLLLPTHQQVPTSALPAMADCAVDLLA